MASDPLFSMVILALAAALGAALYRVVGVEEPQRQAVEIRDRRDSPSRRRR